MGLLETLDRWFPLDAPKAAPAPTNGKGQSITIGSNLFWPDWPDTLSLGANLDDEKVHRETAYAVVALAYICMDYRARKLSEAPPIVIEETDEGDEWLDNHELNPILARPNVDYAMAYLYHTTSIFRDTTGACLWVKIRDRGGRPVSLYPFNKDQFTVRSDKERLYAEFEITTQSGPRKFGPEDVVYFFNYNSVAPLDVALAWLDLSQQVRVALRKSFVHAIMPSSALEIPEILEPDTFDRTKGQLSQSFQHAKRTGDPLLLSGGAKWHTIAMSMRDLLPAQVWSIVEATVCAVFNVRPEVLGLITGLENAPWSHMPSAQKMVYEEMAIPRWTQDAEVLTQSLLREFDADPTHLIRFDTENIPALQEDQAAKSLIAEKAAGYLTVDEKRQLLGYEPLGGEMGETILVPLTMQPLNLLAGGGMEGVIPIAADEDEEPVKEPVA